MREYGKVLHGSSVVFGVPYESNNTSDIVDPGGQLNVYIGWFSQPSGGSSSGFSKPGVISRHRINPSLGTEQYPLSE